MKRFTYLLSLTIAAFAVAAIGMVGCEGPAGPPGQNGTDGTNGADMDATCKVCHNETSDLLAKQSQAAASAHLMGGNQARSEADCAACHTHEGYLDRMASGEMAAAMDIMDPTPPNCRTCHNIHNAYAEADYELRYPGKVTLWINDVEMDFGAGNTCANCHQPRVPNPMPVLGGDSISITSPYWGPHHGSQSAMLWGTAGYELTGTESYPTAGSSTHASAGCTKCHMVSVPEYGSQAGGHTFNMTYESHGHHVDNISACTTCHTSLEDDFDHHGKMTETIALTNSLKTILIDKGWVSASSGRVNVNFGSSITLSADNAGAMLNYFMVAEDKSKGIHNPAYTTALLKNSIQSLN